MTTRTWAPRKPEPGRWSLARRPPVVPASSNRGRALVIAAVPIFEGDVAVAVGLVAGVPWPLAVPVSAGGTVLATFAAVAAGTRLGGRRTKGEREKKILARVEKWGVPLAMLLGGFFLSVTFHAFVMSSAGLNRSLILVSGVCTAVFNVVFVALLTSGILAFIF